MVVLARGTAAAGKIEELADAHAAFDRARRRVLRAPDLADVSEELLEQWRTRAAAVMLNAEGMPALFLEESRATSEPWIEDAFLRASSRLRQL